MFKTIVLFSDGTGNSSASPFKTNVFRLYDALDMSPDKGQIAYYDDGVGSSQHRWLAAIGGAFGFGMKRNVLDLYKFLTRHYSDSIEALVDPNTGEIPEIRKSEIPKIACFGFSRGAFTIRVLLGLVDSEGLPVKADSEAELDRLARCAYRRMRAGHFRTRLGLENLWRWPRDNVVVPLLDRLRGRRPYDRARNRRVEKIDFLGLWDTVGAYGMPVEELRIVIDRYVFPLTFSSYDLLDYVKVTRHALSIDDERDAFTPIPFDDSLARKKARELRAAIAEALVQAGHSREDAEKKAHEEVSERSRQIWFAGVHANVGGGYPDDSQAILPLRWIMKEAMKAGVVFREGVVADICAKATAFGQLYDSRSGLSALYRYKPRDIAGILNDARRLTMKTQPGAKAAAAAHEPATPLIHESVVQRMALRFEGYAPIALPARMDVVDDDGRLLYEIASSPDDEARKAAFMTRANGVKASPMTEAIEKLRAPKPALLKLVTCAVFWRRVMYQATLWSLLVLVFLTPLLDKDADGSDFALPLSDIAAFVGGYLPGFLSPWLEGFVEHPIFSAALGAIFLASFLWGGRLRVIIADRSRAAWGMADEEPRGRITAFWDDVASYLLNCGPAVRLWDIFSNRVLPASLLALAFAIVLFATDRFIFHLRAYRGGVCRSSAVTETLAEGARKVFSFETAAPCLATGVRLEKGRSYLATFSITKEWRDAALAANLGGLKRNELGVAQKAGLFLAGLAVRRVIDQPWFKPMLQVGEDAFTILPADPTPPFRKGDGKEAMTVRFKAPKSLELFLYVNDAYSGFLPTALLLGGQGRNPDGAWRHAYGDNAGEAKVTLEALPADYGD
ncbi:DUF2235 domain-containing protein [Methylocystis sp. JAN1]|uniref:DUF2235 domain-containing protein n=1 Tax=Methylocystis sp. JAN1 TaxID=3397211 RepID=UPI003FA342DE